MLTVKNILDDRELGSNFGRVRRSSVTLQSCDHIESLLVLALANQ